MSGFTPAGARQGKFAVMEPAPSDFTMPTSVQPYVKLHGSVNWVQSSVGQRVLVIGGQNAMSIGRYPLLTWYHAEFRKMLLRPSARLMVIGYSFSDSHINDATADGAEARPGTVYHRSLCAGCPEKRFSDSGSEIAAHRLLASTDQQDLWR